MLWSGVARRARGELHHGNQHCFTTVLLYTALYRTTGTVTRLYLLQSGVYIATVVTS